MITMRPPIRSSERSRKLSNAPATTWAAAPGRTQQSSKILAFGNNHNPRDSKGPHLTIRLYQRYGEPECHGTRFLA